MPGITEKDMDVGKIEFGPESPMLESECPACLEDLMPDKSVLVDLTNGKRKYKFKGQWTGNDVRLTLTAFPREYKLYMRDIRRDNLKRRK